ncbi:hypothetical protein DPMN_017555 [Dreissena polymorpha]|uniref:Uncharacterized protein n=1 Tax=Dreissena polymorpha TaxID=45954 RepID=A0A9D4NF22_DREPO|nr:hypothetical protein DPMN_017555 [Dreissena polymorpha]
MKLFKASLVKYKFKSNEIQSRLKDLKFTENHYDWKLKVKDNEIERLKVQLFANNEIIMKAKNNEKELKEAKASNDYLQSLQSDSTKIELELFDTISQTYSMATVECVMNLTDLKVPSEKVGEVIRTVALLCGKTVSRVPAPSTVNRFVDSKIALAHKHIASKVTKEMETTLYTDETRKFGKCV